MADTYDMSRIVNTPETAVVLGGTPPTFKGRPILVVANSFFHHQLVPLNRGGGLVWVTGDEVKNLAAQGFLTVVDDGGQLVATAFPDPPDQPAKPAATGPAGP